MKQRGIVVMGLVAVLAGCGGGTDYATFRKSYVDNATYGDKFADPPPELSDDQIDTVIAQVCPDGPDGKASLDAADKIGATLAGKAEGLSPSGMGSAIYFAVRDVGGCDPWPRARDETGWGADRAATPGWATLDGVTPVTVPLADIESALT